MLTQLEKLCRQVVLAGDPRQECFQLCHYFSEKWSRCINPTDEMQKVDLVNNYRSCKTIVQILNKYASIHFPSVGGSTPQVSMRGECTCRPGECCLHIIDCNKKTNMAKAVVNKNPDNFYVMSPVTVKTYGYHPTHLSLMNKLSKGTSGPLAGRGHKSQYKVGTSMKLKGVRKCMCTAWTWITTQIKWDLIVCSNSCMSACREPEIPFTYISTPGTGGLIFSELSKGLS